MLNEHTINQLRGLRLDGMVRAIEDQAHSAAAAGLSFEERLTLLVQREVAWRDERRVARLLKAARLKEHRKFKRPLQARQALGKPDTTAWFGPCAPIDSLKRHLEPRHTSRAASHARAPKFTRGLRPSAGTATLVARSAVPAAGHARQPRHAFGGCGARLSRAQCAQAGPTSRARPLGGGCGSSPRWPRIFSITGRSRMAAMIFSSPPPQFGQCCMSMSKRSFSAD